jgi:hypothetical protein
MSNTHRIMLVATFLWIGFVAAISFMEAWLKFQAPGITLTLGLGIGRLVFSALNTMEWIFASLILFNLMWGRSLSGWRISWSYFLALVLLLLQTVWLLPVLDALAESHMVGNKVPDNSNEHVIYIFIEAAKVSVLFIFGIRLLKPSL